MSREKKNRVGYRALADAIVEIAAKDYMEALSKLKKKPESTPAGRMKADCERFFKSYWIVELTDIDGEWLMRKLREEVGYEG